LVARGAKRGGSREGELELCAHGGVALGQPEKKPQNKKTQQKKNQKKTNKKKNPPIGRCCIEKSKVVSLMQKSSEKMRRPRKKG